MTDDNYDGAGSIEHDDPITVEAEYTPHDSEEVTVERWTFERVSPQQAKDRVIRDHIPPTATLSRVGLWHGSLGDRPDGGHETGILQQGEDRAHQDDNENHTLEQF